MVRRMSYIPDRGDIVWTDFFPGKGHEQAGRRPALALSPRFYNEKSGLFLVCPITSKAKGYTFEVPIAYKKIQGVVLSDQITAMDWRARAVTFIEKANGKTLAHVREDILQLLTEI